MVRLLILILIIFAGLFVGPLLQDQKGYVLIALNDWTIESSLVVMVMVILVFYALLQFLEWGLVNILTMWGRTRHWFGGRRQRIAQQKTLESVLQLASGQYIAAEMNSVKNVKFSDLPLLNYLTAANAAQRLGNTEKRDIYLAAASDLDADSLALQSTRLRLQIESKAFDSALQWMQEQDSKTLNKIEIMRFTYLVYAHFEQWKFLQPLLPALLKQTVIDEQQCIELQNDCDSGLLTAAAKDGLNSLKNHYKGLDRKIRNNIDIFAKYAKLSIELNGFDEIEKELFKKLTKQVNKSLIVALSSVGEEESVRVSEQLIALSSRYPDNVDLMQVIAQLLIKSRHWPLAKEWLTKALEIKPSIVIFHKLALVQQELGEQSGALNSYQKAVQLMELP